METEHGDKVRKIIQEYSPKFVACYKEALRQLNNMLNAQPQSFYTRNKAGLLHNINANLIKSELYNPDRVLMDERHDSLIINIDGVVMARFKKLDEDGNPQKSKTDRSRAFVTTQLTLFSGTVEKKAVSSIEVGYRINDAWTEFLGLDIVNSNEHWSIPMDYKGLSVIPEEKKNNQSDSEKEATNG